MTPPLTARRPACPSIGRVYRRLTLLIAAGLGLCGGPVGAQQQDEAALAGSDEPVAFSAEQLTYDRNLALITARGDVSIEQAGYLLTANTVSYNQRADVVTASGDVVLLPPSGDVLFADYVELTGNFRDGVIETLRLVLADGSRLAAGAARREDAARHLLDRAVYSPCDACEDAPERPLLWQVKAISVVHDIDNREIVYRDAWLELFGVPVAYTPYLSHPDPTVRRRSGFLSPEFGGNADLGATFRLPYYYAISNSEDLTFQPLLTTEEGVVLDAEYRRIFPDGDLRALGSLTQDSASETRGHIDADAEIYHNPDWRTRLQLQHSSDDTYLKRYDYSSDPWETSSLETERFDGADYNALRAYNFQELREDVSNDTTPTVGPDYAFSHRGEESRHGAYWSLDGGLAIIGRERGAKSRRLSAEPAWTLPYVSDYGEIYTLRTSLQADGYHTEDVIDEAGNPEDGFTGRLHPKLSLTWQLPMSRREEGAEQIVEPVAMFVAAPSGNNPGGIPNEDSRDLEFDDTNVIVAERFTGSDRVESGSRINYGVNWALYGENEGQVTAFIGQTYRLHQDRLFPEESGLEENFSDIVGRVQASPGELLDVSYRFQIDREQLDARRNELQLGIGPSLARLSASYLFLNESDARFGDFDDREELYLELNSTVTRYWSASAFTRHDLTENGGPLRAGGGLVYEDECLRFDSRIERDYTDDRDDEGGYTVLFLLTLKTLGTVSTGG